MYEVKCHKLVCLTFMLVYEWLHYRMIQIRYSDIGAGAPCETCDMRGTLVWCYPAIPDTSMGILSQTSLFNSSTNIQL